MKDIIVTNSSQGETIPIRLFLGGFDLTPTFRDVNKKYSTRYYLSLVLIDEGKCVLHCACLSAYFRNNLQVAPEAVRLPGCHIPRIPRHPTASHGVLVNNRPAIDSRLLSVTPPELRPPRYTQHRSGLAW